MCELASMTIADYRAHLKLTQEAFAAELQLSSKGFISEIEASNKCSAKVALAIEAHSKGLVDAGSLNADVAAARGVAA